MVDDLNLLLHNRDLLSKAVMQSDLSGQLLDLCISDRLVSFQLVLHTSVATDICDDHTGQRKDTGNDRCNNSLHWLHPQQLCPGFRTAGTVHLQAHSLLESSESFVGSTAEAAVYTTRST